VPKNGGLSVKHLDLPTPGTAIAPVALFVSLGGVGYAAAMIGSAQIKNNCVASKDIRNRTSVTKDSARRRSAR
jgi:hypothetical protein